MVTNRSTRRSFISVAGAALSAPLMAAGAALPAEADDAKARLAALEDKDAIHALNQLYARHVNAGAHEELSALFADPADARVEAGVRGIAPDGFGEQDEIEIATDRRSAVARVRWTVYTEAAIGPSCTLVEMARLQGEGVLRSTESALFENRYVRRDDGRWMIGAIERASQSATS